MSEGEYVKLIKQIDVLEDLMPVYSGRTIDNIMQQLNARVKEATNPRCG